MFECYSLVGRSADVRICFHRTECVSRILCGKNSEDVNYSIWMLWPARIGSARLTAESQTFHFHLGSESRQTNNCRNNTRKSVNTFLLHGTGLIHFTFIRASFIRQFNFRQFNSIIDTTNIFPLVMPPCGHAVGRSVGRSDGRSCP